MKVSSQILLPGNSVAPTSSPGNSSDNGQFAGLVSANSPPADGRSSEPTARPGKPDAKALADDGDGSLQSEQRAPAEVLTSGDERSQLSDPKSEHSSGTREQLAEERPAIAAGVPQGGNALPVAGELAVDPALVIPADTAETAEGEAETIADVVTLLAGIDATLAAPAAPLVKDQVQAPIIANTAVEADPTLANGDEAAAPVDTSENPAAPVPVRRDAAPRPGDLEQLRSGQAQILAWDQAQQTILAPARQPVSTAAQPSLGEVALAPDAGKDAREGASTAQLLVGSDGIEKSDLKSLKELREARLAASPAAATKAGASDSVPTPQLVDSSSATRAGSAPAHSPGAAPASPTDTSLAQLVDRLIETRVAARSERSHIELTHPDFGRVTLAVGLRADDRLTVDLPGAPTELRQAVGQALAQQGAAQGSGQNTGQNTGNNGNQASSQRGEGQAQASLAGGENSQNSHGQGGDPRNNTYESDNPHLSIFAQSQAAGSDSGASKPAGGPASGGRRGVLA